MAQQKRQLIESLWHRQFSSDQAEFSYRYTKGGYLEIFSKPLKISTWIIVAIIAAVVIFFLLPILCCIGICCCGWFGYKASQLSFSAIDFENQILCRFLWETKFSLVILKNSFINDKLLQKHFEHSSKIIFPTNFHYSMFPLSLNALCESLWAFETHLF
jgi:hypothetical protein